MPSLSQGISSLALCITLLVSSSSAFAHAHLKNQLPAAESETAASPQEIVLEFSEGVEPGFSGIQIIGPEKRAIKTGKARRGTEDTKQLVVPVEELLKPGTYQVEWHVVSVDGHKTQGHYRFIQK